MNGDALADLNVHDYILRTGDRLQQEVDGLLSHLYMHRVFYYHAACHGDWRPMHWFHSLFDVFVYCDWMNPHDMVQEPIQSRFVCLKHNLLFPAELWKNFVSTEGPLLTAIAANPNRSQFLLRDISHPVI